MMDEMFDSDAHLVTDNQDDFLVSNQAEDLMNDIFDSDSLQMQTEAIDVSKGQRFSEREPARDRSATQMLDELDDGMSELDELVGDGPLEFNDDDDDEDEY